MVLACKRVVFPEMMDTLIKQRVDSERLWNLPVGAVLTVTIKLTP